MIRNTLILALLICFGFVQAQKSWDQANELYDDQEYQQAVELYQGLIEEGYQDFNLYFNLGNAYYKMNRFSDAILNYEKSLLIDSGNEDAIHNLGQARKRVKDKTNLVTNYDNNYLAKRLSDYVSFFLIQIVSITLLLVFLIFFLLRKKKGESLRPIWLILIVVLSSSLFWFSQVQKSLSEEYLEAIVFAPRINVKSSPSGLGTSVFVLHEGVKVRVLSRQNEWLRVSLDKDKIGWVKEADLEEITLK